MADASTNAASDLPVALRHPPSECSLMPFWFWNDDLSDAEIRRQIDDFAAHGVDGFVIHPRVGLPRSIGWMSDAMLRFMRVAVDEAARRGMKVILYDEGMYPSGSSCGQVVAKNPAFACRGLAMLPALDADTLPDGHHVVAQLRTAAGDEVAIIDRPIDAFIRGLHYVGEGPAEDEPPMGDILNPDAVALVIELIHERFHATLGDHFGSTIIGVFTDEPSPTGRLRERDVWPGTTGILGHVNRLLGYDFTPHLPALWRDDEPDAQRFRRDYRWAVRRRMEETWYTPLSRWCAEHGVALCGHPQEGDEIGALRFFQIPGQDLVWRWVAMDEPSALHGPESTQGKASSSAMVHLGRRRNSNEFAGAYGPQTTFAEFRWLAYWCLVRGVNLLIPHAFYYSVRGPRRDERPPQVGPNSAWWGDFKPFADACRRLCWVNTDSRHACDLAILTGPDHCPWAAAAACFRDQRDFNYLEDRLLLEAACVSDAGVAIAGMCYRVLIVEDDALLTDAVRDKLRPMIDAGRLVRWTEDAAGLAALAAQLPRDVTLEAPTPGLRVRHVVKGGAHYYLFFNEDATPIDVGVALSAAGAAAWIDPADAAATPVAGPLRVVLPPHEVALLRVES
jgi:hypothetical protein